MANIGDAKTGPDPRMPLTAGSLPPRMDITHRRNRLAGVWAAELLGLIGFAAQDYVRSVMHPGHLQEQPHEDDHDKVVGKLARDLSGRVSVQEIRQRMADFLQEAKRQARRDREP